MADDQTEDQTTTIKSVDDPNAPRIEVKWKPLDIDLPPSTPQPTTTTAKNTEDPSAPGMQVKWKPLDTDPRKQTTVAKPVDQPDAPGIEVKWSGPLDDQDQDNNPK